LKKLLRRIEHSIDLRISRVSDDILALKRKSLLEKERRKRKKEE
jgi:hypothetical protein